MLNKIKTKSPMRDPQSRTRAAFTLIEILIVITIISILAAILFPVFTRARENARRSSCMSNLKQIGLGVMQYTQDYDEKYPFCSFQFGTSGWTETVSPCTSHYTPTTQLYRCPSSYKKSVDSAGTHNEHTGQYGANLAVLISGYSANPPLSMANMPSPSGTYIIFDAGTFAFLAKYAYSATVNKSQYLPGTGPGTASNVPYSGTFEHPELEGDFTNGRHFGGINVLFADGHVKWLQSQDAVEEARTCGSGGCTPDNTHTQASAWNPWFDH